MEKRLMRSQSDRMVAGVAAGLAEYFNIDPAIVRLLFVLMAVMGGHGLLIYLILWLVMPEVDEPVKSAAA
ncbi:MAG: PspC domain-containing protein [Anaerolineales bacterium]|nr:PspC domain-containing protein [Anaerolineales bacterium]MCB0010562.1 PspC domain-containing protein [Anaerolineales bacterium]MCB0020946.1 PspC domain-containing protein [Anaerolineales bacterium]MCB8962889.1 PspC domain-containing protein [Ardenticatenales bacterium]